MKTTIYSIIFIFCILLTACNKPFGDNLGVDDPDAYSVIYSTNAAEDSTKNTMVIPMDIDTTFSIYANMGGIVLPSQDVTVKFKTSPELVDEYNELNQTSYPLMLEGSYQIDNLSVTIKKGKVVSSPVEIKISSKAFDGVGKYVLPLQIESVTPEMKIHEKLRTIFFVVNGYYKTNPFTLYSRDNWSIAGFSTDETEPITVKDEEGNNITYSKNGRAISIIDGVDVTFWCSQWRNAKPGPPHWIAIDMGEKNELHGLKLRGRPKSATEPNITKDSGNPRIFYVEVSDDNQNWERIGNFAVENKLEHIIYFDHKQTARYFKVVITATQADFYGTHIGEIYAF